jgi:hypothetical protein
MMCVQSSKSKALTGISCNMAPTSEVSQACPREAAQRCRCSDWATGYTNWGSYPSRAKRFFLYQDHPDWRCDPIHPSVTPWVPGFFPTGKVAKE